MLYKLCFAKTYRKRKKYCSCALEISLHVFIKVKAISFSSSGTSAKFIDLGKFVKDSEMSEVTFLDV